MEFLILGLLILSPMTGYELQQFIKQNLSLICSHSAGSVQSALAKLLRTGFITCEETTAGKRRKKTFFIADAGRSAFQEWVSEPMQADKVKNMELSRMFFLGLAQPEERVRAIEGYLCQLSGTKAVLNAIQERFHQVQQSGLPAGQDWVQVFRFQEYTIRYGIAAAEFEHAWYTQLLKEMKKDL